jgi:hypothetical protein
VGVGGDLPKFKKVGSAKVKERLIIVINTCTLADKRYSYTIGARVRKTVVV